MHKCRICLFPTLVQTLSVLTFRASFSMMLEKTDLSTDIKPSKGKINNENSLKSDIKF